MNAAAMLLNGALALLLSQATPPAQKPATASMVTPASVPPAIIASA